MKIRNVSFKLYKIFIISIHVIIIFYLIFNTHAHKSYIIEILLFNLIIIFFNKIWIYKFIQVIIGFSAFSIGFFHTPFFLNIIISKGEIKPDENMFSVYVSVVFMLFSIITFILYYLSQDEINKNRNCNKLKEKNDFRKQ